MMTFKYRHILSRRTSGRGFSLIEVLAALMIFSIAVVTVVSNLGTSLAIQGDLLAEQRAAGLAANVMEETRMGASLKEGNDSGQFKDDDKDFSWSSKTEKTEQDGLMQVAVTVSWNNGRGQKDYTLTTLLYDEGGVK